MNITNTTARPVFVIFEYDGIKARVGPCHRWCAEWSGWEIINDIILIRTHWVCGQCGEKLV